jgi:hypothetical protein
MRDAFLALLNADRDRSPLASDDPEVGVYGAHKCLILDAAIARGFAAALEELDGLSCGLDLATLGRDSRIRAGDLKPESTGKSIGASLFGACGSVGASAGGAPASPLAPWPLAVILGLPAALAAAWPRLRRGA